MSQLVSRLQQPHELLNHILDQPELPALIQSLDPGVLARLIRHVGLEDSGEIVALATVDQLRQVFDEDLWASEAPGRESVFDAERFGVWLEVLLETGPAFAARKVMEMDEDLVTLGLGRLVLVVGLDGLAGRMSADHRSVQDDLLDKVLESTLNLELDAFLVMSRIQAHWDAVCTLLAELNECDHALLSRLLERCCRISEDYIEDNGTLFDVLTADEMLEADMAAERDQRRGDKGYVTAVAAAAFLDKARRTPLKTIIRTTAPDPAVQAYLKRAQVHGDKAAPPGAATSSPGQPPDVHTVRFLRVLQEAEVLPAADIKRLDHAAGPWEHPLPLAGALRAVQHADPVLYSRRLVELTYLSNVLMTGCALQGRDFRPVEAAEAASATCNLGAEIILGRRGKGPEAMASGRRLEDLLGQGHLIRLFQAGWKTLYEEVVRSAAEAAMALAERLQAGKQDPESAKDLGRWADALRSALASGRPWEGGDPLDELVMYVDGETAQSVAALLQPYPTMSRAVRRNAPGSWTAFIGTMEQVRWVRRYLRRAL